MTAPAEAGRRCAGSTSTAVTPEPAVVDGAAADGDAVGRRRGWTANAARSWRVSSAARDLGRSPRRRGSARARRRRARCRSRTSRSARRRACSWSSRAGHHVHVGLVGAPAALAELGVEQPARLGRDMHPQRQAALRRTRRAPAPAPRRAACPGGRSGSTELARPVNPPVGAQQPAADVRRCRRPASPGGDGLERQLVGGGRRRRAGDRDRVERRPRPGRRGCRSPRRWRPGASRSPTTSPNCVRPCCVAADDPAHADPPTHPARLQHERHTRSPAQPEHRPGGQQ